MAKTSGAKKKAKRKDFQKVKFKVGKQLPKNLNETRATFKAKTLILKQQFHQEKEGPVSHRNLSWKELLAHLGHYNQAIKIDAVNSLREMIKCNDELIQLEFSTLLENACPLLVDRDYKVREMAIQLFRTLIAMPFMQSSSTSNGKHSSVLQPFYGLIHVHLSCAMTHIVENVQYSSLKFLDILIEHVPDLVRLHAYTIFENFIDQISTNQTTSGCGSKLTAARRTLKNDPYKLTSTQAWRQNVLSRLLKMLTIVASSSSKKTSSECDAIMSSLSPSNQKPDAISIMLDNKSERQCLVDLPLCEGDDQRFSFKISKQLDSRRTMNDTFDFFDKYIRDIAPLLTDCWIEARPENKNIIDNFDSISIMHSVLSIFNLFLEKLNMGFLDLAKFIRVVSSKNQESYLENLYLSNFPYNLSDNFEFARELKKNSQQITANTINLLLCKFCSSSMLSITDQKLLNIFEYALNSLDFKRKTPKTNIQQQEQQQINLSPIELKTILKLTETIFSKFHRVEIVKPFLIGLVNYFDSAPLFSANKWLAGEFLCQQFSDNARLVKYEKTFILFFKKLLKYLVCCVREKRNKCESLIDWIRRLVIRKQQKNMSLTPKRSAFSAISTTTTTVNVKSASISGIIKKTVIGYLDDEFINILNAIGW